MAKSEEERVWGLSLSMAEKELPLMMGIINHTAQQIKKRCDQLGEEKLSSTPDGQRLTRLLTMIGGLKYMIEGVDGVMNAMVLYLLKDSSDATKER